ncbi:Uncharacterized protein Fot_10068 [Forsythia ovata]|uniref:Uncharacterized protein n=1 Tax=Forsythia ovata TaxID=205694 RepID=A0ABD1WII8_9LAMI
MVVDQLKRPTVRIGKSVSGGLRILTFSGKFSLALLPLNRRAASSYALAAASVVSNVPNHTLAALCGSLISDAHLPHGLYLTPLYLLLLSPVSSFEVLVISTCGGCAMVVVVADAAVGWYALQNLSLSPALEIGAKILRRFFGKIQ